jgi:tRNA(Ile2) C34 agmatinyltransferase TiaS
MIIYVGLDDTDTLESEQGTGKIARWFEERLPAACRLEGVVRQQLLIHERIPYTSHNSAACLIVRAPGHDLAERLVSEAAEHLAAHALPGSDPGLCVASEGDRALDRLAHFGRVCTRRIVTRKEALEAASGIHLSGHGGTRDGIIGAAAAVGLTVTGWCGRFIEYGRLREIPGEVSVSELEGAGMVVVAADRDARVPAPGDRIHTRGWLRPRLWGGRAVVLVTPAGEGAWASVGRKRGHRGQDAVRGSFSGTAA